MNMKVYWDDKIEEVKNYEKSEKLKEDGNKESPSEEVNEIGIRKMIIMEILNIPEEGLSYYLKRDSWLKEFAFNDMGELNHEYLYDEIYIEKRDIILEECFYKADYGKIHAMLLKYKIKNVCNEKKEAISKSVVCKDIEELLKKDIYEKLEDEDKDKLKVYEKIYFYPIELVNEYIEEKSGKEVYYTILMEQWKTANEMAADISAQRNNMNNFYMSLISILIGGILLSDQILNANIVAKSVLYISIAVIGFVLCRKWRLQIDNYGRLNNEKYSVINELERHLPANVMLYEWMKTEKNARKEKRKVNFTEQEISIARMFGYVVWIVPLIMLFGAYLESRGGMIGK